MKTLTETLNETLENTLQLEIAKIVDNERKEPKNETSKEESSD